MCSSDQLLILYLIFLILSYIKSEWLTQRSPDWCEVTTQGLCLKKLKRIDRASLTHAPTSICLSESIPPPPCFLAPQWRITGPDCRQLAWHTQLCCCPRLQCLSWPGAFGIKASTGMTSIFLFNALASISVAFSVDLCGLLPGPSRCGLICILCFIISLVHNTTTTHLLSGCLLTPAVPTHICFVHWHVCRRT